MCQEFYAEELAELDESYAVHLRLSDGRTPSPGIPMAVLFKLTPCYEGSLLDSDIVVCAIGV